MQQNGLKLASVALTALLTVHGTMHAQVGGGVGGASTGTGGVGSGLGAGGLGGGVMSGGPTGTGAYTGSGYTFPSQYGTPGTGPFSNAGYGNANTWAQRSSATPQDQGQNRWNNPGNGQNYPGASGANYQGQGYGNTYGSNQAWNNGNGGMVPYGQNQSYNNGNGTYPYGQNQGYGNGYPNRQDTNSYSSGRQDNFVRPGYGSDSNYSSTNRGYADGYGGNSNGGNGNGNSAAQAGIDAAIKFHYDRGYQDGYTRGRQEAANRSKNGSFGNGDFHSVHVIGELAQLKKVTLPGIEEPMLVGQVKTMTGQHVLVNLGAAKSLDKLSMKAGESITVHGLLCQRCFPPILLAEQVRYNGKRITIEEFEGIEPQRQTVQGKLEKLQNIQLPGLKGAMLMGLVKTKQGQCVLVSFGSSEQTGELELQEGTQVRVRGDGFEVGEQQVLFANQVRANGQTVTLDD